MSDGACKLSKLKIQATLPIPSFNNERVRMKEKPGFQIGRVPKTWIFRLNADNLIERMKMTFFQHFNKEKD